METTLMRFLLLPISIEDSRLQASSAGDVRVGFRAGREDRWQGAAGSPRGNFSAIR
jgi:hypothetical protein